MPTGKDDFFLSFGSDASEFSGLLKDGLAPGIASIEALIEAMENYDSTVDYVRSRPNSSPLSNLFTELDRATSQFGNLTRELAATFQGAITGIKELRGDLSSLVNEIQEISSLSQGKGQKNAAKNIVRATEEEVASVRPRGDFNLQKIIDDAWNARNALKRVGDINATVARNASASADALSNLGAALRMLTLQGKASQKNVEEMIANGNIGASIVVVQSNGAVSVAGTHEATQAASPASGAETEKAKAKAKKEREELTSLSGPARVGSFVYQGEKLSVGSGIREGESFQSYFDRVNALKNKMAEAYRQVPQLSSDFDRIIQTYKSAGNKFPQDLLRPTNGDEASSRGDIITTLGKIGRFDELAKGVGLTPGQKERLPDALRAVQEQAVQRDSHLEQALRSALAEDPFLTQDGLSDDAKRILRNIDRGIIGEEEYAAEPERPAYLGAANRQRIRESGAEHHANVQTSQEAKQDQEASTKLSRAETKFARLQKQLAAALDEGSTATEKEIAELKQRVNQQGLRVSRLQRQNARARSEGSTSKYAPGVRAGRSDLIGGLEPGQYEKRPRSSKLSSEDLITLIEEGASSSDSLVADLLGLKAEDQFSFDRALSPQSLKARQQIGSVTGLQSLLGSHPDVIVNHLLAEQQERVSSFFGMTGQAGTEYNRAKNAVDQLSNPETAVQYAQELLQAQRDEAEKALHASTHESSVVVTPAHRAAAIAKLRATTSQQVALPPDLYHVTTALDKVVSEGLKTRDELGLEKGPGLSGGPNDTISLTGSKEVANNLEEDIRQLHGLLRGDASLDELRRKANASGFDFGPNGSLDERIARLYNEGNSEEFADAARRSTIGGLFQDYLFSRENATGRPNPVFYGTDLEALEKVDPSQIGTAHFKPKSGAKGLALGTDALGEFRISSGSLVRLVKDRKSRATQPKSTLTQESNGDLDALRAEKEVLAGRRDELKPIYTKYAQLGVRNAGDQQAFEEVGAELKQTRARLKELNPQIHRLEQATKETAQEIAANNADQKNPNSGVKARRAELKERVLSKYSAGQIRERLKNEYGFTDNVDNLSHDEVAERLARKLQQDEAKIAKAFGNPVPQVGAGASSGGRGGGGRKPPSSAAAADDDSNAQGRNTNARKKNEVTVENQGVSFAKHIALLEDDTKAVLANARAELVAAKTREERIEVLKRAGAVFREDPHVRTVNSDVRNATFAQALGIPYAKGGENRKLVVDLFKKAGYINADPAYGSGTRGGGAILDDSATHEARRAQFDKALAVEDLSLRNAYLAETAALEKLQRIEREEPKNLEAIRSATIAYNNAILARRRVEAQVNPTTSQRIFGQKGFAQGLLRNAGYAAENFLSFTLLFTGFEHLKEALGDATKAQVEFTRVQAALDATGRSADGLRSSLQGVASTTAQSQAEIVSAAAELTGVLKTNEDLATGAGIAGQLANISQGALTAKDAAVELRDVIDAFGLEGAGAIQRVGDEVAKISQITGVGVKDVLEGTANLAQEAHAYKLNSFTSGILAAEVTKNTGETGEGASEQVSRILSTLNNGKVQDALVRFRVATREQFANGDLGDILKQLLAGFDKLSPSAQQAIFSLTGAGKQARAFTGLLRDSGQLAELFNGDLQVTGALASQNARFLHTLGGEIKQLESDFTSLTSTLLKLGLFDIIGVTAKALDDLLKILNEVASAFNSAFDSNPVTANLKHVIITLGEAVIAFKLFRIAMASALGKGAATGAETGAEAVATSAAGGVSRGTRISQRLAPAGSTVGLTTIYTEGGPPLRTARPLRYLGTAGERLESAVSTAASTEASTLAGRAAQRAAQATRGLAVGLQSLGDVMIATGRESKAASISAGAINGVLAGLAVAIPLILEGYQKEKEKAKERESNFKDIFGTPDKPDSEKTPVDIANDNASSGKSYSESYRDFFSGGPKGTSGLTRLKNIGVTFAGLVSGNPSAFSVSAGSGGDPSEKFNNDEFQLMHNLYAKLRGAKTPAEIAKIQKEINETLGKNAAKLIDEAGDSEAQTTAQATLANLMKALNDSADKRHSILEGQKQIDVLNAQQMVSLGQFISSVQGLNSKTLASTQDYIKILLHDSFFAADDGSVTSKLLGQGTDPNRSTRGRLRSLRDAIDINLPDDEYKLGDQNGVYGKPGPQHDQLLQAVGQQVQILQQLNDTLFQQPIQAFQAASEFLSSIGHYDQSANKLKQDRNALLRYLKTLDRSQPEFWSTLKQINDNELKIAQVYDENINYQSDLEAARSEDPITKAQAAKDKSDRAVKEADKAAKEARTAQIFLDEKKVKSAKAKLAQAREAFKNLPDNSSPQQVAAAGRAEAAAEAALADAQAALASDKGVGLTESQRQANINKASTDLAYAQTQEALKEAQISTKNAGLVSQRTNLQNQLNEVLRQEQVYRQGVLKDDQKLVELEGQEANLRLQLLQQQQADKYAHEELIIAQLQARGGGDLYTGKNNDNVKAARLQLQEAKQKAKDYLNLPGSKSTDAEYQQLLAQVAAARRNAFDTALQSQLDTLDFQVNTYKISSAQEVEALRQILKNKQLTLAEQRQITEKIVSLQKSVRDQLTSGGFNIPTDIKLPSAYQIRRSLGSTGGSTIVTTTNNTNNVNINNVVPSTAMANAVARQVLNIINGSNAAAARANAPVPPLVGG